MTMDAEARALVAQLVAALGPLTSCTMRQTRPADADTDQRTMTFGVYRAADTAVAAAKAALAATAGQ